MFTLPPGSLVAMQNQNLSLPLSYLRSDQTWTDPVWMQWQLQLDLEDVLGEEREGPLPRVVRCTLFFRLRRAQDADFCGWIAIQERHLRRLRLDCLDWEDLPAEAQAILTTTPQEELARAIQQVLRPRREEPHRQLSHAYQAARNRRRDMFSALMLRLGATRVLGKGPLRYIYRGWQISLRWTELVCKQGNIRIFVALNKRTSDALACLIPPAAP